jgi:hypothetical protein
VGGALLPSLIFGPMRQRAFVVEHLAEIAHIDPSVALETLDEMLGFIVRRIADSPLLYTCRAGVTHPDAHGHFTL